MTLYLVWPCKVRLFGVSLLKIYHLKSYDVVNNTLIIHIHFCVLMILNFTGEEVETETTEPSHKEHEDL